MRTTQFDEQLRSHAVFGAAKGSIGGGRGGAYLAVDVSQDDEGVSRGDMVGNVVGDQLKEPRHGHVR